MGLEVLQSCAFDARGGISEGSDYSKRSKNTGFGEMSGNVKTEDGLGSVTSCD